MLPVSGDAPQSEVEPEQSATTAIQITIPGTVTGRFEVPGDVDWYRITLQQGQTVLIETTAHDVIRRRILSSACIRQTVNRFHACCCKRFAIRISTSAHQLGHRRCSAQELGRDGTQRLYLLCGEVNRIFRAPQGPDSDSLIMSPRMVSGEHISIQRRPLMLPMMPLMSSSAASHREQSCQTSDCRFFRSLIRTMMQASEICELIRG